MTDPSWKALGYAFDPKDKKVVNASCRAKRAGVLQSECTGLKAVLTSQTQRQTGYQSVSFRCLSCGQSWTTSF